jgi:hypothetical protein
VPCGTKKIRHVLDEIFGSKRNLEITSMSLTIRFDLFQEAQGFAVILTARSPPHMSATDCVGGRYRSEDRARTRCFALRVLVPRLPDLS